jgi:hypothetical protein
MRYVGVYRAGTNEDKNAHLDSSAKPEMAQVEVTPVHVPIGMGYKNIN